MTKTALEAAYRSLLQRNRLKQDAHQAKLVSRLSKLQDDLVKTNNNASLIPGHWTPNGLYIYGTVGTGKSRLADLFTETLPPDISRRRVHFHEFMNDIHSRLHQARSAAGYAGDPLVKIGQTIFSESRVLCFDEFQVTDIADAMLLGRLFGSIWRQGGVMVSTSNRHPDGLYENGLNRDVVMPFIRELQERCEVWEIGGRDDYRMRSLLGGGEGERVETFLTDQKAYDRELVQGMDGRDLQTVSLPVYGSRELQVNAITSNGTIEETTRRLKLISGTFDEFCSANLGPADYYALCSATNTIFISGLRKFDAGEKDVVRRFITLIDLAYEKSTRVICLSSVPLAEVFTNIVPVDIKLRSQLADGMRVRGKGGASSSMMSTYIGETEWSATGLAEASLGSGGAGETDVGFAVGRAVSRLYEMGSKDYGIRD